MTKIPPSYYSELRLKMHSFARRHYANGLLQNLAVFIIASLSIILIISLLEYFIKSSQSARAYVFYASLLSILFGFLYLVAMPFMRMFGLIKGMSEEELSKRIGKKVSEVDDKLLNILLLEKMKDGQNEGIIDAAVNQKAMTLQNVPFHLSASVKRGIKFVRIAGIFIILIMLMGMTFPDFFNYGTKRLVYYNSDIQAPPPFNFIVNNSDRAIRNESYTIDIKIEGDVLPTSVFIEHEGKKKKALRIQADNYSFSMNNVTEDFSFKVSAEEVTSKEYEVVVFTRPSISDFNIEVKYPSYLNMDNKSFENIGNLSIPEGSHVYWNIRVSDGEFLKFGVGDSKYRLNLKDGIAAFDSSFRQTTGYSLGAIHSNGLVSDSINYRLSIVPDKHPEIELYEREDSLQSNRAYYGKLTDDYGLSDFRFGYSLNGNKPEYKRLNVENNVTSWDFFYDLDWSTWDLQEGDEVVYFFEVWDNDGINGRKKSRSGNMMYRVLDKNEIIDQSQEISEDIENEMMEAIKEAKELKEDIADLQKDMIDEKKMDWSSKKQIEELLKRNEALKKQLQDINSKNKQKNKLENKLNQSDEINQKREELERLMEEILDDETLEKLKQLEELMDKLRKEEVQKAMEEIEISNEDLEKELDRSLELFKQLEFEKQLEKVTEKLDELLEDQEELRQENEEGKEDLSEKQDELKKEFKEWEKELEKLSDKNEELENKHDVNKEEEKREETKNEMNKASEEMKKGKNKKAGENQKNAEQKMSEMKDDLNALQSSMQAKSMEDIQSLRNTLENLVEISFQQERIMEDMKAMRSDDPKFNDATRDQRSIVDGMKVVEDSLTALSKRIVQIEPIINRETKTARREMEKSIKGMTERKLGEVSRHQQLAMTSINNLAVLLDEVVNQLQQQMMQSSGQCKNPGNSKPSSASMNEMQKKLNKQIEEMKKKLEQGKSPGEGKGGEGKPTEDAKSLAKMAAEQAKIREELRKMSENASQKEAQELKKIGEMMEESERDIVNRQISQETIMRQEKILTRLLESEKAERQQDMEERREAVSGNDKKNGNLFDAKEYYNARYSNHEDLIKENISFKGYYKDKAEEYFKMISQ